MRKPGRAYLFPLTSDEFRFAPDYRRRVYRTDDGGEGWEEVSEGLPQEAFYSLVLRDANGPFAAITLAWLVAFAVMASKAGGLLTRPRVKAGLDRFTGVVLIGLGLRLATERR